MCLEVIAVFLFIFDCHYLMVVCCVCCSVLCVGLWDVEMMCSVFWGLMIVLVVGLCCGVALFSFRNVSFCT